MHFKENLIFKGFMITFFTFSKKKIKYIEKDDFLFVFYFLYYEKVNFLFL